MKSSKKNKPYKSDYGYWRKVMAEFEQQDLPQQDFCKCNNYDFRQFRYYRSRLSRIDRGIVKPKEITSIPPTFAAIQVASKPIVSSEINLPGKGASIDVTDFVLEFKSGIRCHIPHNFDTIALNKLVSALR